ncbi:hypothetical protein TNCT_305931 [Trichonephila clavata]|uniref:Uncharacterized protein n=1 Tax=Trichonephila clavata TaxID=2740835 RepID=A0A8X6G7G3_TRICU|nr:hypothetical protein TNCT_305931 [Trichonephila clavata]
MEHDTRSMAGYGNVSIYSSISNFKSVYARASVHIWTKRADDERLCCPEHFSTVAYLQMKHVRNPRTEGKKIFTSLMDLPPVSDMVLGRQSELMVLLKRIQTVEVLRVYHVLEMLKYDYCLINKFL